MFIQKLLVLLFISTPLVLASPAKAPNIPTVSEEEIMDLLKEVESQEVSEEPNMPDGLEPINRPIYHFNRTIDGLIFKPLAVLWRDAVHNNIKKGVSNFISNLFMPVQTINLILQGEGAKAFESVFRMATNTTVGILGVMDPATQVGWKNPNTNFNETLTKWGFAEGPYIMLPILGPSCMRSLVGIGFDWFANPLRFYVNNKNHDGNHHGQQKNLFWAVYAIDFTDQRAKLIGLVEDIDATSPDTYLAIREYFHQAQRNIEKKIAERHKNNAADRA